MSLNSLENPHVQLTDTFAWHTQSKNNKSKTNTNNKIILKTETKNRKANKRKGDKNKM